jgi:restriction system protein
MSPFLEILNDGKEHSISEIKEILPEKLNLTEEDKLETLPSGQSRLYNRIGWARTHLKKACLIETVNKGVFRLTQRGTEALKEKAEIDIKYLKQFPEYQEFIGKDRTSDNAEIPEILMDETPEEMLENAKGMLAANLASDLYEQVINKSPEFFEQLIAKLLVKMGYGGSEEDILQSRGKSGDEGIDGIIKQDVLGLDKIYIQAKRWNGNVSRPEIQKFVGAVHGQNANKGVFVTTSSFTGEAVEYAKKINSTIILIDGQKLTELMIKYNIGVQVRETIEIKKIDSDFFEGE